MLQVWRELRASEQDYTFDHVVSTMEVHMAAHQARIEYLVQRKNLGLEREGRLAVIKFYKLNAAVDFGRQFAMGDGSLPPRHQTYQTA